MSKNNFFYRNSLSIILIVLMLIFWLGQFLTGWKTDNDELAEQGKSCWTLGSTCTVAILFRPPLRTGKANFCR